MRRLAGALLTIAVLGVLVATLLPELWPIMPRATMFAPMAPQFAGVAAVLMLPALLSRRWLLAALCLGATLWNAWTIWPDVSPLGATAQAEGRPALKVMSFNLWYDNADIAATARQLAESGADVIGLVEATPPFEEGLEPLKRVYPYSIDCVGTLRKCQVMLFSKYPLKNAYAGPTGGRYPYIAMAQVDVAGTPITIGVTHLSWPFVERVRPPLAAIDLGEPVPTLPDVPALEQSAQAANLAAFLAKQPADLVLMGDFNSASWSPLQIALRKATGLAELRKLLPSWPTWAWPIFRLPIDHVFARGRARVVAIDTAPDIGSDHFPLEAEIAVIGP